MKDKYYRYLLIGQHGACKVQLHTQLPSTQWSRTIRRIGNSSLCFVNDGRLTRPSARLRSHSSLLHNMTQRYSNNGNGYVPNQSFGHRQPTTFTPAPPTGLAQTNFSTAQALPPLSASNYPNAVGNDPFMPSRTQPQQSTSLAGPAASSQPGTFPVYPPTASTHYASHNGLPTHPPLMQTSQISNAQATNGQARPAYTSSAPPNIQLPKIQPAPMANGDFKHAYLPEKKGMQLLASAPLSIGQDVPLKHVVGSQGRRGVLPSAAGRPPAVNNSNTTGGKNSPALAKDNDGKYPCPHCSKPYLHAKHLKRHMLRRKVTSVSAAFHTDICL